MMRQTPTTPTAGIVMATVKPSMFHAARRGCYCYRRRHRRSTTAARAVGITKPTSERQRLDDALSDRFIALDPAGYFLVWTNDDEGTIGASHFDNVVGEDGLARDPETGEVIPCDGSYKPKPTETFKGRTAKEISVEVFESGKGKGKCSMMTHANYLGREFQRAEECLRTGKKYVQD
jgi:dihydropteroate synthase